MILPIHHPSPSPLPGCGLFAWPVWRDYDADGLPDSCDRDDDNDGLPDALDPAPRNAAVPGRVSLDDAGQVTGWLA